MTTAIHNNEQKPNNNNDNNNNKKHNYTTKKYLLKPQIQPYGQNLHDFKPKIGTRSCADLRKKIVYGGTATVVKVWIFHADCN